MYQKVAPMFLVKNVDEVADWYRNILGAKLHASLPKNPPFEWVSLLLDDVEIMFSQQKAAQRWYSANATISETPASFIAYIYVKEVNNLYEQVKGRVKIIVEPKDQWYGIREFAIRDPVGSILVFAQIIE